MASSAAPMIRPPWRRSASATKREALTIYRTLLAHDNEYVAHGCEELALTLSKLGRHEEVVALMREAASIRRTAMGAPPAHHTDKTLARILVGAGEVKEAEELLLRAREALATEADHRRICEVEVLLGRCLSAQGRGEEALAALRSAHERCVVTLQKSDEIVPMVRYHWEWLGRDALRAMLEPNVSSLLPEDAAGWRRDLDAAVAKLRELREKGLASSS